MNKAILMGRLTRDPELKTTPSNISVCTFTIAVDRRYKSEKGDNADFIPIVSWRQQAEFVARYFKKGSKIIVIGSIQTRNYENKEGKRQYVTEVVAEEIYFPESKRESSGSNDTYSPSTNGSVNRPNSNDTGSDKPYVVEPSPFGDMDSTTLPFDL